MDISKFSMYASQASLMHKVSLAVTKMAMNTAEDNSDHLVKMLESSVQPDKGQSIDIKL